MAEPIESKKRKIPVLEIENLAVAYKVRGGEIEAVQNVSLTIHQGQTCGIVGESGCGKSTIAWSLVNFLGTNGYVKRGSIRFQGKELRGRTSADMRRLRGNQISMVFQDPMQALNPSMRLGDQLEEVLTVHSNIKGTEAEDCCVDMLKRVYIADPGDVMKRYPHQISGGQQQRVVIAMALLNKPALLIMDEPTTALDVTVEAVVLDLVAELRQEFDTAIMFITHNLGVVARTCDSVGVMYAGEMVELASIEDVFDNPRHPYTQGLIRCVPKLGTDKASGILYPIPGRVPSPDRLPAGCIFWPRCSYAKRRCQEERPRLRRIDDTDTMARCHFSEEIDHHQWRPSEEGRRPAMTDPGISDRKILSLDQLKKYYPVRGNTFKDVLRIAQKRQVKALEKASFDVPKGRTLGIVGESGCGKSTLLKTIVGLEEPTGGKIEFLGFDISNHISYRDAKLIRELQMVFQNPDSTMNPFYTVGQQIARPMIRFKTVKKSQIRSEVVKILKAMRLSEKYFNRLPRQLSGGEKQRVGIARALACQPGLVLCDEPVSALDVSVQAAILNLLLEIQNEFGTTLVFISHNLSVVRFISDYVCVMYLGQIMELGPAQEIYAPPYHPYTEALLSAVPIPDPHALQTHIRLSGTVPSALTPPPGCRFNTRCPRRELIDDPRVCETDPPWRTTENGHKICCHLPIEKLRSLKPVINPLAVARAGQ